MDKYSALQSYSRLLFAIHASLFDGLLKGSGDSCTDNDDCTETNELCFESDTECWCPAGYTGEDCTEPNTHYIDDRCQLPTLPDYTCSNEGDLNRCSDGCTDGTICCSTGCRIECVDPPEKTCTTSADCPANNMCVQVDTSSPTVCKCPLGYQGEDCTDGEGIVDERCPYPGDLIAVCVASEIDIQCREDNPCPNEEICCIGSNGCSTRCIPVGCENPVDRKTCTDQNKICVDDDSTTGFNCRCPFGYSGTMCATPFAGFDAECPFPEVPGNTCDEFETTPTCTEADDCEDDKVCCSTGCGTACVDLSDPKPPGKKPNLALIALLLSTRRQRPPVIPVAPPVPIYPVAPIYPVSPVLPVTPVRCPPNQCVCSKNLGAICQRNIGGCGAIFIDQHTKNIITQYCKCDPGYQIYSPCSKDKCFDMYGRQLVCPGHPNARCRVTQCGRCQAYWIDMYTGKQVTCQRIQPVNPGTNN
uniref:fibropellin-1-like isoform X1 n=1 Tax=Styela clava TaxID=7725 RepID=UPI00193A9F1F|nr:fibropellin-1-like isoform X1 [Styela clava]